jgi:4-aminobutyrate aminotransferase-like enzyme
LKVLEIIQRDRLADHARETGAFLLAELGRLQAAHPNVVSGVRGLGLMIGLELASDAPSFTRQPGSPSHQFVTRLHEAGLLTIPAGNRIVRILPPLNLTREEAGEALETLTAVVQRLA